MHNLIIIFLLKVEDGHFERGEQLGLRAFTEY